MAVIPVALAGRSYSVEVGHSLLERAVELAAPFLRKASVPVVADRNACALHVSRMEACLAETDRSSSVTERPSAAASAARPKSPADG